MLQEVFPGVHSVAQQLCECGGTGVVAYQVCPVCSGDRMTTRKSPLIIPVPQGVPEGHRILVQHEDKTVGDLVFRIVEQEEPGWRRKGGDLFLDQLINPREVRCMHAGKDVLRC